MDVSIFQPFITVLDLYGSNFTLAFIVIVIAAIVQYGTGVAFGLIAAPLLALINLDFVPIPVLMLTIVTAVMSVWSEREGIRWHEIRFSVLGRFLGSIIGVMILSLIPSDKEFMLLFGLIIAFAVVLSLGGLKIPFNNLSLSFAGLLSGLSASITSVGGPPMALVYQDRNASDVRPTLQTYFATAAFITLGVLGFFGHIDFEDFVISLFLLPGLFVGIFLGPYFRPLFDRNFKPFLLTAAGIAAALLIIRGLS